MSKNLDAINEAYQLLHDNLKRRNIELKKEIEQLRQLNELLKTKIVYYEERRDKLGLIDLAGDE